MNVLDIYDTQYMRAEDLDGKSHVVQIIRFEAVEFDNGRKRKAVIHTKQFPKGVVLNESSARRIAKLYGTDDAGWIGQWVTIFATDTTDSDGELVPCIRVRSTAPPVPVESATKPRKRRSTDEVNDK